MRAPFYPVSLPPHRFLGLQKHTHPPFFLSSFLLCHHSLVSWSCTSCPYLG